MEGACSMSRSQWDKDVGAVMAHNDLKLNDAGIGVDPMQRITKRSFTQIIDKMRDGKGYRFGTTGLDGYFYKAPYPDQPLHTMRDGALSAITFWKNGKRHSPTLMLYDFDDKNWWIEESLSP
jgi:hypothetical protein